MAKTQSIKQGPIKARLLFMERAQKEIIMLLIVQHTEHKLLSCLVNGPVC